MESPSHLRLYESGGAGKEFVLFCVWGAGWMLFDGIMIGNVRLVCATQNLRNLKCYRSGKKDYDVVHSVGIVGEYMNSYPVLTDSCR